MNETCKMYTHTGLLSHALTTPTKASSGPTVVKQNQIYFQSVTSRNLAVAKAVKNTHLYQLEFAHKCTQNKIAEKRGRSSTKGTTALHTYVYF